MVTVAEIATWRSGPLREASADLRVTARRYAEVADGLEGMVNDEVFVGLAGDAEAASRRVLAGDMREMQGLLEKAANDFDAVADAIDQLVPEAEGIRIELGGAEMPDVGGAGIPDGVYWRATRCMSKGDAIVTALENVYGELGGLVAAGEAPRVGIMSHGVSAPKAGWSVGEVHDWWTSLSREEQETIITSHPEWIGNLNGIPIDDRHAANMNRFDETAAVLDAKLEEAEAELGWYVGSGLPQSGPGSNHYAELYLEVETLKGRKEELEVLRQAFVNDNGSHKLVSLDGVSGEHLRAVVAIGDVDRADRVMVHTPGMTSTVSGSLVTFSGQWGGDVEGVQNVLNEGKTQLDREGRDDELAGVVFLGYDAPQWSEIDSGNSVVLDNSAVEGGENLAGLLDSIQTTHEGDLYLVASGHSYGSTVTGYALRQSTAVDEVMVMGSPGITTRQNQDLNMIPGHVNVGEAEGFDFGGDGDFVADLGWFGGDPSTSREFNTIGTDEWTSPEGVEYTDSKGHSEYYDAGRTSVYDQASVLIGNGVVAGAEQ